MLRDLRLPALKFSEQFHQREFCFAEEDIINLRRQSENLFRHCRDAQAGEDRHDLRKVILEQRHGLR